MLLHDRMPKHKRGHRGRGNDKQLKFKSWDGGPLVSKPEAVLICVILAIFITVVGAAQSAN